MNKHDKVELTVKLRKNVLEHIFSRLSRKDEREFNEIVEDSLLVYFNVKIEDLLEEYTNNNETVINEVNHAHYIYAFLDSSIKKKIKIGDFVFPYEPFYIGKGKGNRSEGLDRNDRVNERVETIRKKGGEVIVLKIKEDLTSLQAYRLENYFITKIGRYDRNEGPLLNEAGGVTFSNPEECLFEITDLNLERNINQMVLDALNNSKTIKDAAKKLGLSERSLYRKFKDLDIKRDKNKKYYYER